MVKYHFLFIILLSGHAWGSGSFHDARVEYNDVTKNWTITTFSVSPMLPDINFCRNASAGYPCTVSVRAETTTGRYLVHNVLVDTNYPASCSSADCNVALYGTKAAKTLGELVPLMKYRGAFGRPSSVGTQFSQQYRTCVHVYAVGKVTDSSYRVDCGPVQEVNTRCDILDTNASVDFGSFSNDVALRQASGSFRINCASDANVRVKFASKVTNIPLSQDGKLNASLKVRNSAPGGTELESFIKILAGDQEIFIDGELKNNNSSHIGPFSASVVAIVEVA